MSLETTIDAPIVEVSSDTPARAPAQRLAFSGTTGEYFGIWIVNLLLTVVTFGIYSAWAKVRTRRYFYRHTTLAGERFDYHAKPTAILVGRLIAAALGGTYLAVAWLAPGWEVIPLLVIFFATPWLLTKGTAFNARNSSYRNVRFAFDGKLGDAYAAFVGWPILGMLSLGAVMPIALQRQARWHIGHHHFGDMPFRFHTPHGPYFGLFWKTIGLLTACSVAVMMVVFAGAVVASLAGVLEADGTAQSTEPSATMTAGFLLVLVATYIGMILTYIVGGAYLVVRSLQIGLGRSTIGDQPFTVDMRVGEVAMLYFTNTLAILFSLGLAVPWAKVRAARYQLEHTAVHLDEGSMQRVTAKGAGEESAIGEEVGEAFDIEFDFGL